jgi:ATP-dependent Clp protease, protease subunit
MKFRNLALAVVLIGTTFACASAPKPAEVPPQEPAPPGPSPELLELLMGPQIHLKADLDLDAPHKIGHVVFDVPVSDASADRLIALIEGADQRKLEGLVIEINTPGGSVESGRLISRAIESAVTPIYCLVDGDAASMGMYILQSCPQRLMTKRSMLMAHNPSAGVQGQEQDFLNVAAMLKATGDALGEHVCHRMLLEPKDCRSRFDGKEWWLGYDEALKVGAIDRVSPISNVAVESLRLRNMLPPAILH